MPDDRLHKILIAAQFQREPVDWPPGETRNVWRSNQDFNDWMKDNFSDANTGALNQSSLFKADAVLSSYGLRVRDESPRFLGASAPISGRLRLSVANPAQWERKRTEITPNPLGIPYSSRRIKASTSHEQDANVNIYEPEDRPLRPYQKYAIQRGMEQSGLLIADDPRLGKTAQAFGLINASKGDIQRVLVIAPGTAKNEWAAQSRQWLEKPLPVYNVETGSGWTVPREGPAMVLLHFPALRPKEGVSPRRDVFNRVRDETWDFAILDEAHYLKNPDAKQTFGVFGGRTFDKEGNPVDVDPIQARHRWALTGTPAVEKNPAALYPLLRWLQPQVWGTTPEAERQFNHRYTKFEESKRRPGQMNRTPQGSQNERELKDLLLSTTMIRRQERMPDPIRHVEKVVPRSTAEFRAVELARAAEQEAAQEEAAKAGVTVEQYTSMIEAAGNRVPIPFTQMSHIAHQTAVAKAPTVAEYAAEKAKQEPVIVYTSHVEPVEVISRHFTRQGIPHFTLSGEQFQQERRALGGNLTEAQARNRLVKKFQDGERQAIIATIPGFTTGLDASRANRVIFGSIAWNPLDIRQAESRIKSVSKTEPIKVDTIVLANSIDDNMVRVLHEKQEQERKITGLSTGGQVTMSPTVAKVVEQTEALMEPGMEKPWTSEGDQDIAPEPRQPRMELGALTSSPAAPPADDLQLEAQEPVEVVPMESEGAVPAPPVEDMMQPSAPAVPPVMDEEPSELVLESPPVVNPADAEPIVPAGDPIPDSGWRPEDFETPSTPVSQGDLQEMEGPLDDGEAGELPGPSVADGGMPAPDDGEGMDTTPELGETETQARGEEVDDSLTTSPIDEINRRIRQAESAQDEGESLEPAPPITDAMPDATPSPDSAEAEEEEPYQRSQLDPDEPLYVTPADQARADKDDCPIEDGDACITMMRPDNLKTDASTFQYKDQTDSEGVSAKLADVKRWDQDLAGVVYVWERQDGERFVVDGHQRLALAKRMQAQGQDPKMLVKYWREADGYTPRYMRLLAAKKNIAEDSGTAVDAARVLREDPDLFENLSQTAAKVRDARGLAKLSTPVFNEAVERVNAGQLPENVAAVVSGIGPDEEAQRGILQELVREHRKGFLTPEEAHQLIISSKRTMMEEDAQRMQGQLFDLGAVRESAWREKVSLTKGVMGSFRNTRVVLNAVDRGENKLESLGNVLATEANAGELTNAQKSIAILEVLANSNGPLGDYLDLQAKRIKARMDAEDMPRRKAAAPFITQSVEYLEPFLASYLDDNGEALRKDLAEKGINVSEQEDLPEPERDEPIIRAAVTQVAAPSQMMMDDDEEPTPALPVMEPPAAAPAPPPADEEISLFSRPMTEEESKEVGGITREEEADLLGVSVDELPTSEPEVAEASDATQQMGFMEETPAEEPPAVEEPEEVAAAVETSAEEPPAVDEPEEVAAAVETSAEEPPAVDEPETAAPAVEPPAEPEPEAVAPTVEPAAEEPPAEPETEPEAVAAEVEAPAEPDPGIPQSEERPDIVEGSDIQRPEPVLTGVGARAEIAPDVDLPDAAPPPTPKARERARRTPAKTPERLQPKSGKSSRGPATKKRAPTPGEIRRFARQTKASR